MTPQVTLTAEFSREGLLELRARLDELLGPQPDAPARAAGTGSADDKIRRVKDRVKAGTTWAFLKICAERFDGEFSLDDVAEAMERPLSDVRAFHRNASRTEKQLGSDLPVDLPPLFESRKEKNRNLYCMPPAIRAAVRAAG